MLTAHATATSGDAGLRATPDKSPPFGSLIARRPQTARRAARPPWPRPQPATPASRHTTGRCHLHQQTDFGRAAPTCPPSTGHGPMLPCCFFRKILHSDFRRYGTFGNAVQIPCFHQPPATRRPRLGPFANVTTMRPGQTSGRRQPRQPMVHRRSRGSLPTLDTFRPRQQPATPTSRHISGRCHFHQQTVFGRTAPNLSTTDGPQSDAATTAIAASFGKFGVASPIRRTSPVMTNKRVKSVLEPARNAAVMAPPSPDPCPVDYPATLPVSLPLHPDHPLIRPQTQKPAEPTRLCGFRSGRFSPVDLTLMTQLKEQIKNFFRKSEKRGGYAQKPKALREGLKRRMHPISRRKHQPGRGNALFPLPGRAFDQEQRFILLGAQDFGFVFGCQHGGK